MSVGLPSFAERAAAAFSALAPGEQPESRLWTVSTRTKGPDIVSDAAAGNSSEDEQEEGRPTAAPPLMSWKDITGAESQEEPSYASRKAFELEDEADEFDILAAETLTRDGGQPEPKPHRSMEVLPDNVMDRICDAQTAGQEWVRGAAEAAHHSDSTTVHGGCRASIRDQQEGRTARGSFNAAKELPPRRKKHPRSKVPDHVQHPEKYTCYTLEEPLLVGCPTEETIAEHEQRGVQAFMEPGVDSHSNRFIPEFGTGIAFRPRGRKENPSHQPQQDNQEKSRVTPLVVSHVADDAEDQDEGMAQVEAMSVMPLGGKLDKTPAKNQHAKGRCYRARRG
ncbi:unnamed protein product [Ostreobium quekettii]|uniref:Uncharacterized protein n=1 Tax=Ostreobium quekettii TaxID=121088 RepID=A0A8S1JFD6_9CHLO|nr:unnamed protein product [Ostreobium quekettii]